MFSKKTEQMLLNYLLFLSDGEKKSEVFRQVLSGLDNFEPYAAFLRLDRLSRKSLDSHDLVDFLITNNYPATLDDVEKIIKYHDTNMDTLLSYKDFLHLVLPLDNPDLRTEVALRPNYNVERSKLLSYEIEYALSRLLQWELDFAKQICYEQSVLANQKDFSISDFFKFIDFKQMNIIDFNCLEDLFHLFHIDVSDEIIINIIRRIDLNDDGRINADEFSFHFDVNANCKLEPEKKMTEHSKISPICSTLTSGNHLSSTMKSLSPSKILTQRKILIEDTEKEASKSKVRIMRKTLTNKKNEEAQKNKDKIYNMFDHKEIILRYLKELLELDKEVEFIKKELVLQTDFNLLDLFMFFDCYGKGSVSALELEEGFFELGIHVTKDEIELLLHRCDVEGQKKLRFSNFAILFTSIDKEYMDILAQRNGVNTSGTLKLKQIYTPATLDMITRLLAKVIDHEREWEGIRHLIKRRKIDLEEIFFMFDKDNEGFITAANIKNVFERKKIYVTLREASLLVRRFTKFMSQNISKACFLNEMTFKLEKFQMLFNQILFTNFQQYCSFLNKKY